MSHHFTLFFFAILVFFIQYSVYSVESDNWRTLHPEWIFCDDFEDTTALVKPGRYFEVNDNNHDFVIMNGAGLDSSHGMRGKWQTGEVDAGSLHLAFGRNPNAYMNKQGIHPTEDFRDIYYRMYLKMQTGWQGSPAKLSRVTVFSSPNNWGQAMIAHLWSDANEHLLLDPASCVSNNAVQCTTYNDSDHLKWLGMKSGTTTIFSTANSGKWFCIEHHVKLNDSGKSNGVQEFWINDNLEAHNEGLNFTGAYTEYALNAVFFENYWNSGSPKDQERYFDNIVVSTARIGMINKTVNNRSKGRAMSVGNKNLGIATQPAADYDICGRQINNIHFYKGISLSVIPYRLGIIRVNGF